jgi:hypothetical protein
MVVIFWPKINLTSKDQKKTCSIQLQSLMVCLTFILEYSEENLKRKLATQHLLLSEKCYMEKCHINICLCRLYRRLNLNILSRVRVWVIIDGILLVIKFIEHLEFVTTRNYSNIVNSHIMQFTTARKKYFNRLCIHQSLPGNGCQRRMFPLLWVPELSSYLSYQLLIGTAHNA